HQLRQALRRERPALRAAPRLHDPHLLVGAAVAGGHLAAVAAAVDPGPAGVAGDRGLVPVSLPARVAALQRQPASTGMSHDPDCIFCKIVEGTIPSKKVYEDDDILAFHDIHPWAPVHFLLVPKEHITSMAHVEE